MRVRRWAVITAATGAVVLLAAAGGYAVWRADLTRQPQVIDQVATMDAGLAATITSVDSQAAVAVAPVVRATTCRVGALRHAGGRFSRAADLFIDPGHEADVLAAIAARLPTAYRAQVEQPSTTSAPLLRAHAGLGVQLQVSVISPGWLSAATSTACVIGPQQLEPDTSDGGSADEALSTALTKLGATAAETHIVRLGCPGGVITSVAISATTDSTRLAERLSGLVPTGAHVFESKANRLAWRTGQESTVIAASDDGTAASVRHTRPC